MKYLDLTGLITEWEVKAFSNYPTEIEIYIRLRIMDDDIFNGIDTRGFIPALFNDQRFKKHLEATELPTIESSGGNYWFAAVLKEREIRFHSLDCGYTLSIVERTIEQLKEMLSPKESVVAQ